MSNNPKQTVTVQGKDYEVRKLNVNMLLTGAPFLDKMVDCMARLLRPVNASASAGYKERTVQTENGFEKLEENEAIAMANLIEEQDRYATVWRNTLKLFSNEEGQTPFLRIVAYCVKDLFPDKLDNIARWTDKRPSEDYVEMLRQELTVDDLVPLCLAVLQANMGSLGNEGKKVMGALQSKLNESLKPSETSSPTSETGSSNSQSTGSTAETGPSTSSPTGATPPTGDTEAS